MKVLVTGSKGMLGQDLVEILNKQDYIVLQTDIDTLDITNEKSVQEYFEQNNFDMIIHTAAYTNVDEAETDENTAFSINYSGTENLAKYSAKKDIPIIYISTDYVFNGEKASPYETYDTPNPLNIYGLSKLKGEESILKINPKHYIVRTSWLYGHKGKNFIETIINIAEKQQEIQVVNDQIGCPTWTVDLANGILNIIQNNSPFGIYHICGSGYTSWYGFAQKIIELMNLKTAILPVPTEKFPRPAIRPKFSVLNNNQEYPEWEKSLERYIELRKNI